MIYDEVRKRRKGDMMVTCLTKGGSKGAKPGVGNEEIYVCLVIPLQTVPI